MSSHKQYNERSTQTLLTVKELEPEIRRTVVHGTARYVLAYSSHEMAVLERGVKIVVAVLSPRMVPVDS